MLRLSTKAQGNSIRRFKYRSSDHPISVLINMFWSIPPTESLGRTSSIMGGLLKQR